MLVKGKIYLFSHNAGVNTICRVDLGVCLGYNVKVGEYV